MMFKNNRKIANVKGCHVLDKRCYQSFGVCKNFCLFCCPIKQKNFKNDTSVLKKHSVAMFVDFNLSRNNQIFHFTCMNFTLNSCGFTMFISQASNFATVVAIRSA